MTWSVVTGSARGASHVRAGEPNQDAVECRAGPGDKLPIAIAVSDGHGSAKCFRSDAGSRLAVTTAVEILWRFGLSQHSGGSPGELRNAAEDLPREIVSSWRSKVEESLRASGGLSPEELSQLESRAGAEARRTVGEDPVIAYGATLIGAVVTESFILYLQLGDGDILSVDANGAVTRPLPADPRLFANQTTSLCLPDASHDVRLEIRMLSEATPALILMATDGYANSFVDEPAFFQVGSDVLRLLQSDGLATVQQHLEEWLAETSRIGSGDDITLAMLWRRGATPTDMQSH